MGTARASQLSGKFMSVIMGRFRSRILPQRELISEPCKIGKALQEKAGRQVPADRGGQHDEPQSMDEDRDGHRQSNDEHRKERPPEKSGVTESRSM